MNLARKLELARASIASITRHDDASDRELAAACATLDEFLRAELREASARRHRREAIRIAAIEAVKDEA